MAVAFITCRHEVTGATADIPETALKHLPAYVPVDADERKRLGYDDPPPDDTAPQTDAGGEPVGPTSAGSEPGGDGPAPGEARGSKTRKTAAGAAQTKE
ncbi:hypothetical protein [Actinoallomurus sp. CA-142502]|uniref:hypothetical protein n=1 Tax=Actinoallomurus sp. CA-142502 TaxID=3239885 RepID=UPI003D8C193B